MKTALLSVFHKDGIVEFAQALTNLGFQIYASGGTYKHLKEHGVNVHPVSLLVGGEAILGHKVVTLSREVHAGLLANDSEEEVAELKKLGIPRIDLVCVDLYPLENAIMDEDATRESVIQMTDIGGPTMLRSAAKGGRIVICDPEDREKVIDWLKAGEQDKTFVQNLAAKAEFTIAVYCLASAVYLSDSKYLGLAAERVATCKYGENAHQTPAHLYSFGSDDPLALDKFKVIEGTPPSYNNLADIDRLLQTMTHIAEVHDRNLGMNMPIAVGAKHGNACGAGADFSRHKALEKMLAGDKRALFGGLIMTNFVITETMIDVLFGKMLDGIVAPGFKNEVVDALRRKGNKCRFIVNPALQDPRLDDTERFRYVRGGFLVQPNYTFVPFFNGTEITRHGQATPEQEADMLLAWAIGSTSNSNTITLVKNNQLIGNGVGQQDRVGAAKLAITRARDAGHDIVGASAYSDSFFPFPDGPQALIEAGVKAIFTSSGSVRDNETIDLCTKHGVALYMVPDAVGRGFFGH